MASDTDDPVKPRAGGGEKVGVTGEDAGIGDTAVGGAGSVEGGGEGKGEDGGLSASFDDCANEARSAKRTKTIPSGRASDGFMPSHIRAGGARLHDNEKGPRGRGNSALWPLRIPTSVRSACPERSARSKNEALVRR